MKDFSFRGPWATRVLLISKDPVPDYTDAQFYDAEKT
jgi:hypothetical protein